MTPCFDPFDSFPDVSEIQIRVIRAVRPDQYSIAQSVLGERSIQTSLRRMGIGRIPIIREYPRKLYAPAEG